MLRNKVVWDKHYYSNRFTVRNIFLLRYSRFRLMCTFKTCRIRTSCRTCRNIQTKYIYITEYGMKDKHSNENITRKAIVST